MEWARAGHGGGEGGAAAGGEEVGATARTAARRGGDDGGEGGEVKEVAVGAKVGEGDGRGAARPKAGSSFALMAQVCKSKSAMRRWS